MRRRDFIRVIAGLGVAWPLATRAQTPPGKIYRLGILQPAKPPEPLVDALIERLKELGYREGRNIAYEYRWAEGKLDRFPELAKQLVDLKVDVITRPALLLQGMQRRPSPLSSVGSGIPSVLAW